MPVDSSDQVQWERVNAELQAAKEAQQRAWGDVDDTTLGRYLSDEVTSAEQAAIENALQTHADLRLLADIVRGVLAESGDAVPVVPATAPPILSFRPSSAPRPARFARPRMAMLAAACLFLGVGLTLFRSDASAPSSRESAALTTRGDAVATRTDLKALSHLDLSNAILDDDNALLNVKTTTYDTVNPEQVAVVLKELENAIDDPKTKQDSKRATNVANHFFLLAAKQHLDNDRSYGPRVAASLNRIGQIHLQQQNLDQAVVCYEKALEIQRKTQVDEVVQRKTCNYLAVPLNEAEAAFVRAKSTPGAVDACLMLRSGMHQAVCAKGAEHDKADKAQDSAVALRDRINRPEGQRRLRENVVPGLATALLHSRSSEERRLLANALANLGPTAREAAPIVAHCLADARTTAERFALVRALHNMGPATTKDCIPVLVQTWKECDAKDVRDAVSVTLSQVSGGPAALEKAVMSVGTDK